MFSDKMSSPKVGSALAAFLRIFQTTAHLVTSSLAALNMLFSARQHAERAICYRKSVRPSVRPSVTRVDQSKTVELKVMQFSPHSSTQPFLVCCISFIQKFRGDPSERGRHTRVGWGNELILSVF